MQSCDVIRKAAETIGVKALAARLRLSPALVYKWCEEFNPNDPDTVGARNPLDRVAEIFKATGDRDVINWLCHEAQGFFVENPTVAHTSVRAELLLNTQRLVKEFSELLLTVTKSIEDDGAITRSEAERIRNNWELFKSTVEAFTTACETGLYSKGDRS